MPDVQFQGESVHRQLFSDRPIEAYRRTELFKVACARGLLSEDQPTPTKDRLILIIENNIVVKDANKLQEPVKPVPLNEAHRATQDPVANMTADPEAVVGETQQQPTADARKIFGEYSAMNNVNKMKGKFKEDFGEEAAQALPGRGGKKADILELVKAHLGL